MNNLIQRFKKLDSHNNAYAIYVYIIAFGLFATPYLLRQQIITSFSNRTFLWGINYIALSALFLFVMQNLFRKKINIWHLFPALSLIALLPTQFAHPITWGGVLLFACCCIFPQYILFSDFSIPDKDRCIKRFLVFFDSIMFILFVTALIDKVADRCIIKQLASFLTCDEGVSYFAYLNDSEHKRFFSILGHPLTNAFLFNAFYALNILYNKYHKNLLPNYIWTIITLLSLICCGGKTGITVGLIITIFTYYRKWQFYVLAAVSIPIVYISGILDNLIYRFTQLPLTTGRASSLKLLFADERISFRIFQGYGPLLNSKYKSPEFDFIHVASEFPLIGHSLHYGIFFALLLLLPPFIYVTLRLCKEKRYTDWLFWCLLYAEVNTYNGFSSRLDVSFIFYFLSFILLNIAPSSDAAIPPS